MPEVDVLKITNEDAAFVLGKNGKTSMRACAPRGPAPPPYAHCVPAPHTRLLHAAEEKIARVSGADLDLFEHSLTLEIRGNDDERKRAKKCALAAVVNALEARALGRPPARTIQSLLS